MGHLIPTRVSKDTFWALKNPRRVKSAYRRTASIRKGPLVKSKVQLILSHAAIWLAACAAAFPSHVRAGQPVDPDADYDRLDGTGKSGKKVDVVEWEGNLEIHVYPAGSLAGLSLKLDKKNKDKPVMVIGYRFTNDTKTQLIRRAILGVPFYEGFKAFKDPTANGYDKIVISNNGLGKPLVAYNLEQPPAQLYPDGHPALVDAGADAERKPATSASKKKSPPQEEDAPDVDQETGAIQPFFMRERGGGRP